MISHYRNLFTVPLLLCGMVAPMDAVGSEPERPWNAYWLTGGANAENGYQWLLISRQKLEKLAVSEEFSTTITAIASPDIPNASPPILDASALWIETHGKSAIWNSSGQPIKIPPLIKNYRLDEKTVYVGDVEYRVEPVPVEIALQLLKEPNGKGVLHRRWPPFYGMENTAKALVALLDAETVGASSTEQAAPVPEWQAYVLTGGEYADGGYRWLLLSQMSLQQLANPETPGVLKPGQDGPAVWVMTHGKGKEWTAVRALAVPPPITDFQMETQTVSVGGVVYKVESVPFRDTIPLLQKGPFDEEKMLKSSVGPLHIRNRTAQALKAYMESGKQKSAAVSVPTKLYVGSSFGGVRSVTSSSIAEPDPRSGTLHGLQIVLGPEKRLRELAVYDNGFLERRETYIEDGFELVQEQFSRESIPGGHGGNGYRRVDGRGTAGALSATLAEGYLLDGKPWHGNFVFVEPLPENKSFEYPVRLVLREYFEGKLIATETNVTLGFGDHEKDQAWLKNLPSALNDK